MDDRAVLERCIDNVNYMNWNEVWWNWIGITAAIFFLVVLSMVTFYLIWDWRLGKQPSLPSYRKEKAGPLWESTETTWTKEEKKEEPKKEEPGW